MKYVIILINVMESYLGLIFMMMGKLRLGSDKVKILFDNVIKNAQHIYDWGELESADLERMRGIIEVLNDCKKQGEQLEQAEKALERIADLHIRGIEDRAAEPHRAIAEEALQAIRGSD